MEAAPTLFDNFLENMQLLKIKIKLLFDHIYFLHRMKDEFFVICILQKYYECVAFILKIETSIKFVK